jgi:hypothetical protein
MEAPNPWKGGGLRAVSSKRFMMDSATHAKQTHGTLQNDGAILVEPRQCRGIS